MTEINPIDLSKLLNADKTLNLDNVAADQKEKIQSIFNSIAGKDGKINNVSEEDMWNQFVNSFDGIIDTEDEFKTLEGIVNLKKGDTFNLTARLNELKDKDYAFQVIDLRINAEQRRQAIVDGVTDDISYKTEIINDTNNEEIIDSYLVAIDNPKEAKNVPQPFKDIEKSQLTDDQKTTLKANLGALKEKSLVDLLADNPLEIPENLSTPVNTNEDVKARKEALDKLLDDIDTKLSDANATLEQHIESVKKNNETINKNIDTKNNFLKLRGENADVTSFNDEIVRAQESNMKILEEIAKQKLVIDKLEGLKKVLNKESAKLQGDINELNDIAKFEDKAKEKAEKFRNNEEKDFKDAIVALNKAKRKTDSSMQKQGSLTSEITTDVEAGSSVDGDIARHGTRHGKSDDLMKKEGKAATNKDDCKKYAEKYNDSLAKLKELNSEAFGDEKEIDISENS